jgi:hypothetical protein
LLVVAKGSPSGALSEDALVMQVFITGKPGKLKFKGQMVEYDTDPLDTYAFSVNITGKYLPDM